VNTFASALQSILAALDRQEVRYAVVGSVASSNHGLPRFTNDVDIVVDLQEVDLAELFRFLKAEFYFDLDHIQASIEAGRSFNVIHLVGGFKFDFFPVEPGPYGDQQLQRRKFMLSRAPQFGDLEFAIASAEDTVLAKLRWFKQGGGVSDRQWNDIVSILSLQKEKLDYVYLKQWGARLGLTELLEKAISSVRPSPLPGL
jgi:predicted nucleotidyltransferase